MNSLAGGRGLLPAYELEVAMVVSSRTPEGQPNRCPICGNEMRVEPSTPPGDAPCPKCGCLVWFSPQNNAAVTVAVVNVSSLVSESGSDSWFTEAGEPLVDSCSAVLLKFDDVEMLTSRMMQAIGILHRQMKLRNKYFALILPRSKHNIREVLKLTGLHRSLAVFEDMQTALQRSR